MTHRYCPYRGPGRPDPEPHPDAPSPVFNPHIEEQAQRPYPDYLTAVLVDDALDTLGTVRSPAGPADPGVRLSCMVSLALEVQARIPQQVSCALGHGYSRSDIAMRLGASQPTIGRRYLSAIPPAQPDPDAADDPDVDAISIDELPVPPAAPAIDHHSAHILAEALNTLILLRFPGSLYDPTADLHALGSLIAQARADIPAAVAQARQGGHPWADIATSLGITPAAARRRYRVHPASPEAPLD